ncbi:hypothetical protein ACGFNU_20870 [Spirillospora sp. NPDC048911]|uniref:S-methyl thiohydantoin desulfurase domain-containing protein n=1 Tax=Spirillospora sp. NPDC048911 TaxID=3364527 RepID=UPI0037215E3F
MGCSVSCADTVMRGDQPAAGLLGGIRLLTGKVVDVRRLRPRTGPPDGEIVATTPDLICVLGTDSGEPVTTEGLRYGLRVTVLGVPCDPRWLTPGGLELAGPRYFGYDTGHVPLSR